jgi:hypothetical protein
MGSGATGGEANISEPGTWILLKLAIPTTKSFRFRRCVPPIPSQLKDTPMNALERRGGGYAIKLIGFP